MSKNTWNILLIILIINFLLITHQARANSCHGKNGQEKGGKKGSNNNFNEIKNCDNNSKGNDQCIPSLHVECAHYCCKNKLSFIYKCWENYNSYRDIIEQHMKGQKEKNYQLKGESNENITNHNMDMSMPMSFQFSTHTIILFKFWETQTETSYYISLIICLLFGILSVILKLLRLQVEQSLPWTKDTNVMTSALLFKSNLVRFMLSFIIYSWDYLLMLIVMTFNVGLFIAVVLGLSIGFFLFGHKFVTCGKNSTDLLEIHKDFQGDPACCGC
ncbi:copper transporter [Plasmodium gonderi]|uniref:Copper transport protein n=1 Tax=Plasmodium gonderi TaxID=77519 RepID=A0A1Y1JJM0_PLAGO|nr:copper transporter [Plasmodium gonderi]GAW82696.1 copper transporter [Plasmodium gonderi]